MFTHTSINVAGVGTMQQYEANTQGNFSGTYGDVNALSFKQVLYTDAKYYCISLDGRYYVIDPNNSYGPYRIDDYHTDRNVPLVDRIISSDGDVILKTTDGKIYYVSNTNGIRLDGSMSDMIGAPVGIDGYPLNSTQYTNDQRARILYNCVGN